MISTTLRVALAAVAFALSACATSSKAQDAQLAKLEQDNQALRAQLGERTQAANGAFTTAGSAEASAGVANTSCTVIAPASGNPPARSGAVHAKLKLANATFLLQPQLAGARRAGGSNVSNGTCAVGRR